MAVLEVFGQQQNRLAYITTSNTKVREKLPQNYEYKLTFTIPISDSKYQHIKEFNFVKAEGQYFTIRKISPAMAQDYTLLSVVECEHVSYELLEDYIEEITLTDCSAEFAVTQALSNSSQFTVGTIANLGNSSALLSKGTPTAALNTIMENWGGEVQFDNRELNLPAQRGSNTKLLQIREGKNLRLMKEIIDATSVITRLYGYGKDGLTIESVNGGLKYIDSTNASLYKKLDGTTRYLVDEYKSSAEDAATLLAEMQAYLALHEAPLIAYEVDLLVIEDEHELGDTVVVISKSLNNINIQARIVEYTRDLDSPEDSKAIIANFIPNIVEDSMMKLEENRKLVNDSIDAWNRAKSFNTDGTLTTSWLTGAVNALTNQLVASGEYASASVLEGQGLLFENTKTDSPDYGALYLGPGIFAIANTKTDGQWDWATFGTGEGFTADLLTAGKILTSLVRIEGSTKFYWDGDALYMVNPSNANQQIRLSEAGIKFTTTGGTNWNVAIDYTGVKIGGNTGDTVDINNSRVRVNHSDGSYSEYGADGPKRVIAGENKPYFYLWDFQFGSYGATKTYIWQDEDPWSDPSGWVDWTDAQCDSFLSTPTITLPAAFQGKAFKVFPVVRPTYQSQSALEQFFIAPEPTYSYDLRDQKVEAININYAAGTFQVRCFVHVRYHKSDNAVRVQRVYAQDFSVLVQL